MRVKYFSLQQVRQKLEDITELEGYLPPSFFVGSYTWPKVTISPMVTILKNSPSLVDEPDQWQTRYQIPEIVNFRSNLIRAVIGKINVKNSFEMKKNKFLELSQEYLLSTKPVYSSVDFTKPLHFDLEFNSYTSPVGPAGKIKEIKAEDTIKADQRIEKVFYDTDLKSTEAIERLWEEKFTVTQINRILSAGMLGVEKRRRIVPTRWAITATDDQVGKKIIDKIKDFSQIDHIELWRSDYLDNHFRALFLPGEWAFEFIEMWQSKIKSSTNGFWKIGSDYEPYEGRTSYAKNTAGGYYAARLAILEYLYKIKRQAETIVFRSIGNDYYIPLGVWQVRENQRSAFLSKKNLIYSGNDKKQALRILKSSFDVPYKLYMSKSYLLAKKRQKIALTTFL